MKTITIYIFCSTLFLFTLLSQNAKAIELNGVAAYSEFNKPIYVGALYLNTLSTENNLNAQPNKRMVLKIEADKLSIRKFNNFWTDGLAINSSSEDFEKHTPSIIRFNQLLKENLKNGDTLIIESRSQTPVIVSLNGVIIGKFKQESFFSLLLAVWIGEVPPSTQFKSGILAGGKDKIDANIMARYTNLKPLENRKNIAKNWVAKPKAKIAKKKAKPSTTSSLVNSSPPTKPKTAPPKAPLKSIAALPEAKGVDQVTQLAKTKTQAPSNKTTITDSNTQENSTIANIEEPATPISSTSTKSNMREDIQIASAPPLEDLATETGIKDESNNKEKELEERKAKNKRFLSALRRR